MKIFITGATGFIGQHLVRKLTETGNHVCVNLFGGEKTPFNENVETYILNENQTEQDIAFLKKANFDGIIHLASLYLTLHKPLEAVKLIDANLRFSTYILECAAQANINWFINTGTFWQNYNNAEYSPVNLYAASKQAFQTIAQYYIETNAIKFVTLKLSDTYGPNDTRPKIFNLWDKIAKTGETLEMSEGEQMIDISYIDDIVEAYHLLAQQIANITIVNGAEFAVKAENRYTLKQLAIIYEDATGSKLNIAWGKRPYREREVMIPWESGMLVPGWKPRYDLVKGIKNLAL